MRKVKELLLASAMTPTLILASYQGTSAQTLPGIVLAQVPAETSPHAPGEHKEHKEAPAARPAPPEAPRPAAPAPAASPHAAPPPAPSAAPAPAARLPAPSHQAPQLPSQEQPVTAPRSLPPAQAPAAQAPAPRSEAPPTLRKPAATAPAPLGAPPPKPAATSLPPEPTQAIAPERARPASAPLTGVQPSGRPAGQEPPLPAPGAVAKPPLGHPAAAPAPAIPTAAQPASPERLAPPHGAERPLHPLQQPAPPAASTAPADSKPFLPGQQPASAPLPAQAPAATGRAPTLSPAPIGSQPGGHAGPAAGAVAPPAPSSGAAPVGQAPAAGIPPQFPPPQQQRNGSRISPAGAAAIGAAAGLVGGFMLGQGAQRLDDVHERRREYNQDGLTVIEEPGRTIVREEDRAFIRHDENERFRELGGDLRVERRGAEFVSVWPRPDGSEVVTVTDENGVLLRRFRRFPGGREFVIIDNGFRGRPRSFDEEVVHLPPPPVKLPPERYVVDYGTADESLVYETLTAPPLAPLPRRYTLDEVRYSPALRAYTRSVDVDTINFDTGSWTVTPDQAQRLSIIGQALNEAVRRNPAEVFLVEGHTDAVGSDVDNLSLSDRRAQAVATILTRDFAVPPENLTTQGYGSQYMKAPTQGPSRENRRVTVRRITPLLNGQPQTSQQ